MPVTLNWVDRNIGSEGTRIYRSLTPMALNALPAPLATVGPGVTTFVDETAERNKVYYYRFGVFKGVDEAVSREEVIGVYPNTGPGPLKPLRGDFVNGYFGMVPLSELFNASELSTLCGFTIGTVLNLATNWLKFAIDGKILFFPDGPLRSNMSWLQLYVAGLVYGVDGPGPGGRSDTTQVNQLKLVTKGEHTFKVRLAIGTNSPTDPIASTLRPTELSEWDRMLVPTLVGVDNPIKWDDIPAADLTKGNAGWNHTQDIYSSTHRVVRGSTSLIATSNLGNGTAQDSSLWRPVLELVL
jgi:hypothetical protein